MPNQKVRKISYDEWVEEFTPTTDSPVERYELPKDKDPTKWSKIWTLIESDDQLSVVSGFWVINTIGYYMTEKSHHYQTVHVLDNC